MAFKGAVSLLLTILSSALIFSPATATPIARRLLAPAPHCASTSNSFNPVFAFGDSTTDTGNAVRSVFIFALAAESPYGQTFFEQPTGRFSDGRLMVDFLCAALNVPFLPPHLAFARFNFSANENFAVAGATALDVATLQQLAGVTSFTSDSLGVQLRWFKEDTAHLDLSRALVYFGEIGGNDYNYALTARRPPQVIAALLASVMNAIADALDQILSSGVKKIVVQGQFPMGCLSLYLKMLNNTPHDQHGCIESIMQVSNQHDALLREVVASASAKYPHAKIVFFDTAAAYQHIMDNAANYNFTNVEDPCYIGPGFAMLSATPPPSTSAATTAAIPPMNVATTCSNPQNYISWDGIHLTDAMYGTLMNLFLTNPKFSSPFPNLFSYLCAD